MNDGRGPGVEKEESSEYLSAPTPNHLGLDHVQTSHIPGGRGGGGLEREGRGGERAELEITGHFPSKKQSNVGGMD